MKRSEINAAIRRARAAFSEALWTLPPNPRWDVTDFGLGTFSEKGLVLVNLATEPEYCEKLMLACRNQRTPAHCHAVKKEDIIVRYGALQVQLWPGKPGSGARESVTARINGEERTFPVGTIVRPGVFHEFWPTSDFAVLGEVSTANDDVNDNFFADPRIGRFPGIEEDEPPLARLAGED
jgi:D-lyxose ketol-isomerase